MMLNPWYLFTISFSWPWIQFGYSAFNIHSGACVEKHYPFHIIYRAELNLRNPPFPLYPTGFWGKFPNRRAFESNANRFRIQKIHNFTTTITSFLKEGKYSPQIWQIPAIKKEISGICQIKAYKDWACIALPTNYNQWHAYDTQKWQQMFTAP